MNKYQTPKQQPSFNPLTPQQREEIGKALKMNANNDGGILLDPKTTRFASFAKNVQEDKLEELNLNAIFSIPVHYSE